MRKQNNNAASTSINQQSNTSVQPQPLLTDNLKLPHDLTQQHYTSQQLQAAKTHFMSMISHELRSPISNITSIISLANNSLLQEQADQAQLQAYFKMILEQTQEMLNKMDSIIEYLKFDEAVTQDQISTVNLHKLINKIIENHQGFKTATATIHCHIDSHLPLQMMINIDALYRVLTIIIGNAIKHTQQGTVHIEVTKAAIGNGLQPAMMIAIKDSGPGIYANDLQSILQDPLQQTDYQAHRYLRPSVRLPYAKLLVERILQGEFTIATEINKGTYISLTIPYQLPETDHLEITNPVAASANYHLLLVEDNVISCQLAATMLQQLACRVDTAHTGGTALALAQQQLYDIIFLDITLPDFNGLEVMQRLIQTINHQTPIVVITSHTSEEDIATFLDHGVVTVLKKPIDMEQLQQFFDSYQRSLQDNG